MSQLSAESDTTTTRELFPIGEVIAGTSTHYLATPGSMDAVINVVEVWHNDVHVGAFRMCQNRPCRGVLRAARMDGRDS